MSKLRFRVVESAFKKRAAEVPAPAERPSDYFGQNVFNRAKMFKYLPEKAYERITDCIDNGAPLDRETADAVAAGMKKWAIEMGATHYTHWFHPLTEGTAESTTPSLSTTAKAAWSKSSPASCWFSRNRMHPVSRTAVSVIRSKHAATRLGTLLLLLSLWATRFVFRQSSSPIPASRWTIKCHC